MALLMREPVANSEQSQEHGEKLEEDRERADEPTTTKTIGTACFAQCTRAGVALASINNLGLVPTKHGTGSSGVLPSQCWVTGVTGGAQEPYK